MIYTILAGGLGNQMFQYALGRAVSFRLGAPLALDTSYFPGIDNRHYELGIFRVVAKVLGPWEQRRLWLRSRRKMLGLRAALSEHLPARFIPGRPLQVIVNHGHDFDPRPGQAVGEVLFQGLWQDPLYFNDIAETLRRDFTFIQSPDETNRRLLQEIAGSEAIALHIRRGDYFNPDIHEQKVLPGVCSLDYYHEAIRRIRERMASPHFFIFSDEPEWARENLHIEGACTLVSHNSGPQSHEDLRLMSHCRHFIIANSTFSWWGAWLGQDPQKIVLAPTKWRVGEPSFYPPGWETINL